MSLARTEILANIRRGLGVTGKEAPRAAAVAGRLADRPAGIIPARGRLGPAERVALFRSQAEKASASTILLDDAAAVPEEIARFLRDNSLPASLRRGSDARLAAMPWAAAALTIETGASDGDDLNAVSFAFGGVAESGTLALVSGADNPTSLNFLPDTHIVVVAASDITGDYETIFARLDHRGDAAALPRSLNLITGPSRSADIEQTLILGAHGPRRLHIIIIAG